MKFAVCFCVHSGELEIKGLLLAASLRKHWPATIDLIACVPENPRFGGLSETARGTLDSLSVRVTSVFNPIGPDFPIANKLPCLDVATAAERIIFLDSDILALLPVTEMHLAEVFGDGFVAKPADLNTSKLETDEWRTIYSICGSTMPQLSVTSTVSNEVMPPYFNSGVIATAANSNFGALWANCFAVVLNKYKHLGRLHVFDQIPLPVAITKSGATMTTVGNSWNFPAHLIPLASQMPILCHYHWPKIVLRESQLLAAVREVTSIAPNVIAAMDGAPMWRDIAESLGSA